MGAVWAAEATARVRQPAARRVPRLLEFHEAEACVGRRPEYLLDQDGTARTPAPDGDVLGVGCEVVVDQDAGAGDIAVGEPFGGDTEVDPVAGVVLHDVQHALGPGGGEGSFVHLPVVR